MTTEAPDNERRKRMSVGLYISCPHDLKLAINSAYNCGYQFIVTQITHPSYARELVRSRPPAAIGRSDRILLSSEWNRYVVAELTHVNLDSEVEHVRRKSKAIFLQEFDFALHLGVPVIKLKLTKRENTQMAQLISQKITGGIVSSIWLTLPMVHPSHYSPLYTDQSEESKDQTEDTWEWWNDFRVLCNYNKYLGLILELPPIDHLPNMKEVDRWIGEPVKALIIPTSYFLTNIHEKPVLSKVHQEVIRKFMSIDVQYIIKSDVDTDVSIYMKYMAFLGKKLYTRDLNTDFVQGLFPVYPNIKFKPKK